MMHHDVHDGIFALGNCQKLAKVEKALEETLAKAKKLEEIDTSQEAQFDDNYLEQLTSITEKAENLANKIAN